MVIINRPEDIIYYASSFLGRGEICTQSEQFDKLKPLIDFQPNTILEFGFHQYSIDYIDPYKYTAHLILPNDRIVKRKFQVIDTLDSVSKKLIFWHRLTIYIGSLDKYTFNNRKLSYVDCPNYLEAAQWIKYARNLHLTNPVNIAIAKCLGKKIL